MFNQGKNHNLNYLIDPTFGNVGLLITNIMWANVEIKDYNVLIYGKPFYELLVKSVGENYEKITQITNHSGYYTKGNLLSYEYFRKHYKLIAIDLSKQTELENKDIKQQLNFIGKLERENGATMFFIIEKSEETVLEFSQNYASFI